MKKYKFKVIDLFSGMGGFSKGFQDNGFQIIEAVEFNEKIANIYKNNFDHNVIVKDINKYSYEGNLNIDVVIGGPPCQGFSIAGNIGRKFIDDPRNSLYKEFVRIVSEIKPAVFVMENVARMTSHNKGKTIQQIISNFNELGYYVESKILNAADYGTAQNRRRTIIVGTLYNKKINWPKKLDITNNVFSSISDLPELSSGDKSHVDGHYSMNHSSQMLKKMSYIKNGGNRKDIPIKIRPESGDARKYIRYSSLNNSVTITGDMRKVFHYNQNRALTPRELMRLQDFPDNFLLNDTKSIIAQQAIGNAVPIKLASAIAFVVKESLINAEKVFPKINYIGNKVKIASKIAEKITEEKVADVFGGSGSVSWHLKKIGKEIHVNDALFSNYVLHKTLIQNNEMFLFDFEIKKNKDIMYHMNLLKNKFYNSEVENLSNIFHTFNKLKGYKKYFGFSLIRRAMIRKMPYSRFNIPWNQITKLRDEEYSYKKYGRRRSYHNDSFENHIKNNIDNLNCGIISGTGFAYWMDAMDFVRKLSSIKPTAVYLDPPYPSTMNKYQEFYETIDKTLLKESKFKTDFTKEFDYNFNKLLDKIIKIESVVSIYISLSSKNVKQVESIKKKLFKKYKITQFYWNHNYKVTSHTNKDNYEILIKITKNN